MGIQLDKAVAFLDIDRPQAEQALRDAKWAADSALAEVRESVTTLRADTHFSLEDMLTQLVQANAHIPVQFDLVGDESRYSRPILKTLYQMAQEGLTNVHKHAQATQVVIEIVFEHNAVTMRLHDDGVGFNSAELIAMANNRQAHFGLQGLQERLDLVGGKLEVDSQPQQGTRLKITIPHEELLIR